MGQQCWRTRQDNDGDIPQSGAGRSAKRSEDITVLYFFIDRQDKQGTAVDVLRGLLIRLLKGNSDDLTKHLLQEYDLQEDALFQKDAIEALWRVFVEMTAENCGTGLLHH